MIRTIVKHTYCKGKGGNHKARAHINYIAYRPGDDRESGGRPFFDAQRDEKNVREVKEQMHEFADRRGVSMHKFILSPGIQEADIRAYTREIMEELSREKGQSLVWNATFHDNTDHQHAHVVIGGRNETGQRIKFTKEDHQRIREIGDDYIYREHWLERNLGRDREELRDVREVLKGGDDREFKLFIGKQENPLLRENEKAPYRGPKDFYEPLDPKDKRIRDPDQDRLDFEKFDRDFKISQEADNSPAKAHRQRLHESQGRLAEFHGDYTFNSEKARMQDLEKMYPEKAPELEGYMAELREIYSENRPKERDLDRLLDGIEFSSSKSHKPEAELEKSAPAAPTDEPEPRTDEMKSEAPKDMDDDARRDQTTDGDQAKPTPGTDLSKSDDNSVTDKEEGEDRTFEDLKTDEFGGQPRPLTDDERTFEEESFW